MIRHEWGKEEITLHSHKWKKCNRCGIFGSAQEVYDSERGPVREVFYAFSLTLLSRGDFSTIRPDCIEKQASFSF